MVESIDIDYNEIDELCIPWVKFLNSIGLETKYCCQGHKNDDFFFIILNESVTDEKIADFILRHQSPEYTPYGGFYKWMRKFPDGTLRSNWGYKVVHWDYKTCQTLATVDLDTYRGSK